MPINAVIALALVASGDTPVPQPSAQLQTLVLSSGYQANIQRLFAALPADVFQRCPALIAPASTVSVLSPPAFAADGYPISGAWKQSFPVRGCGNDTTINIFFEGQPNEKIVSIVAVPGDTHANLTLQADALRYVRVAAQAAAPGCATPHVRHTRYDGVTDTARRAWRETWYVAACGRNVEVPVTFIPDATGTTVTAGVPRPVG